MEETLESEISFDGERRSVGFLGAAHVPFTLHRPPGESKGTVLMLPGWSGPRSGPADILSFLASGLSRAGWASLRIDLPGRGDALSAAEVDLDTMIESAASVFGTEAAGEWVTLGICSGGNVAIGSVPLPKCASCRRAIALSTFPFQPARTKTFDRRRRWKNLKKYAAKALSPHTWLRLYKGEVNVARVQRNIASAEQAKAGRNLKDSARDIEAELRKWSGSALFVWGGGDEEGAPARAHYEKLHAQGMGAPGKVRFHTIPGANHNFYGRAWRFELLRTIAGFLDQKR